MEFNEVLVRTLRAGAGCMLTQSAEVSLLERTFTPQVCLAAGESADNWKEIDEAEAKELIEAQRAELEKLRAVKEKLRAAKEKEARRAALEAELKALDDEQA